mgnify:CR=1 FL=1
MAMQPSPYATNDPEIKVDLIDVAEAMKLTSHSFAILTCGFVDQNTKEGREGSFRPSREPNRDHLPE